MVTVCHPSKMSVAFACVVAIHSYSTSFFFSFPIQHCCSTPYDVSEQQEGSAPPAAATASRSPSRSPMQGFLSLNGAAAWLSKRLGDVARFPEHARLSEPVLLSDESLPVTNASTACLLRPQHNAGGPRADEGSVSCYICVVGEAHDTGELTLALGDLRPWLALADDADSGLVAATATPPALHWHCVPLSLPGCGAWEVQLVSCSLTASADAVLALDARNGHAVVVPLDSRTPLVLGPPTGLREGAKILAAAADQGGRRIGLVVDDGTLLVLPLPQYTSLHADLQREHQLQVRVYGEAATQDAAAAFTLPMLQRLAHRLWGEPLSLGLVSASLPCDRLELLEEGLRALRLLPFDTASPLEAEAGAVPIAYHPPREYIMCNRKHFLRVRSLPSGSAPVIGRVNAGKHVRVLARHGDWLRLELTQDFAYPKPEKLLPSQAWARQFAIDGVGLEHMMLQRLGASARAPQRPAADWTPLLEGCRGATLAQLEERIAADELRRSFDASLSLIPAATVVHVELELVVAQAAVDVLVAAGGAVLVVTAHEVPETTAADVDGHGDGCYSLAFELNLARAVVVCLERQERGSGAEKTGTLQWLLDMPKQR